jgi:hypothetical protein
MMIPHRRPRPNTGHPMRFRTNIPFVIVVVVVSNSMQGFRRSSDRLEVTESAGAAATRIERLGDVVAARGRRHTQGRRRPQTDVVLADALRYAVDPGGRWEAEGRLAQRRHLAALGALAPFR